MTDGRPGGRFERHPRLTGAGLFLLALVLLELGLRLAAPRALVFAHEMRSVHRYSRVARVDLRPSQSAALRIDRADGQPLFDFRLDVGPDGLRVESPTARSFVGGDDARRPPRGAASYLHAIGDSYTMGWGVGAADSYPAQLQRKLREAAASGAGNAHASPSDAAETSLRVLNLGVDGFGAIGATAKSRALAHTYPPSVAVYLFSPNDLDDDARAAAVARRSGLAHTAHELLDAVRRRSYLAGIPFALRYRLQFRAGPAPAAVEAAAVNPESLLLPEPPPPESQDAGPTPVAPGAQQTLTALVQYREFLDARGARLLVLVLSDQPESLAAYRFCREQGIEAHIFEVPPALRIPDEGHFSAAGNEAVASIVAELLRGGQ